MNEREAYSAGSDARGRAPGRPPGPAETAHEEMLLRYLGAMAAVSSKQALRHAPAGQAEPGGTAPERAGVPAEPGSATAATAPLLVRDVMQVPAPSVPWDLPFQEVARLLAREGVGSVAVVGADDRVVGVVSESDLLAKAAVEAQDHRLGPLRRIRERRLLEKARGDTAEVLMTSPAITVLPGASVAEAAWLVALSRLKRVPVTDHEGRLVGSVHRNALLHALIRDDAGIEKEIRHLVTVVAGPGAADAVQVGVRGGVVDLRGRLPGAAAARLMAEIEDMDDVVEVRGSLVPE
ncbi:CBS domain-containing protein [Streptomyces tropicalis]|uniref:CBS domain-containing protein n=1 Tax=Streptomyces tropicalis TaxID=3034234 RepID=A0ABT6ACG5_9ACTN|nr:CBS domain-containing protein [Streptomyces tropicalis]MDF3301505.1 CBS domain-containing protein [Streptomyces tropicalis]